MKWIQAIVMVWLGLGAGVAKAETRSICVFDPGGRSGDYFALMSKFATNASQWGVEVVIKPYTDEETAAKDYEAGSCDGVVATGVRLQRFNRFASTIEAIGAIPDYPTLKQMVTTLSTSAGASSKLTQDGNTVVGFVPIGGVYLFVRDRSVDSVAELAGKRIATLDYDQASVTMVDRVGAIIVPADLGTIGPKFNNGDVDACYASAPAYKPFELARGVGTKGGILRAPLAQATLQVMIRESKFPAGFVQKARTDMVGRFDEALAIITRAESAIPAASWVDVPKATLVEWDQMFQGVRLKLRDEKKAYDGSMLTVMRQLRCSKDGARSECAEAKE
ncbi:MAG: putative solute-binding protein [Myxococcota bacterium]